MYKAFPLPVKSFHCQKKFPLLVRKVLPAEEKRSHGCEDCTAIEDRGDVHAYLVLSLSTRGRLLGIIFELIRQNKKETRRTKVVIVEFYKM
nr:hypothetical protein [Tanacetum cinerariifolium]